MSGLRNSQKLHTNSAHANLHFCYIIAFRWTVASMPHCITVLRNRVTQRRRRSSTSKAQWRDKAPGSRTVEHWRNHLMSHSKRWNLHDPQGSPAPSAPSTNDARHTSRRRLTPPLFTSTATPAASVNPKSNSVVSGERVSYCACAYHSLLMFHRYSLNHIINYSKPL